MVLLALLAAVAGGSLGVTTSPARPVVGHRLHIQATGEVGRAGGRLYIYRDSRGCLATARSERRRGVLIGSRAVAQPFYFSFAFTPRRAGKVWVCGYLYAITCDAAGRNCGPQIGLPPDAGYMPVPVRVRARPARSAARP